MKSSQDFLTVVEAANKLKVSEETVRRWIRSKSLSATRSGREFLISRWHLESFILTGGKPLYEDPDLLTRCSLGFRPAFFGSFLFDQAYFKVEIQWERIREDYLEMERGAERERKELREMQVEREEWNSKIKKARNSPEYLTFFGKHPLVRHIPNYWSLPLRTLFADIHFYFVAAESLRKTIEDRLKIDVDEPEFTSLVDEYKTQLKDIKKIRGMLEHIDEQVNNPKIRCDLGNLDDKGFRFGNKHYNFYISDIRKLRDELCDFFLSKTLPGEDKPD